MTKADIMDWANNLSKFSGWAFDVFHRDENDKFDRWDKWFPYFWECCMYG